MSTSNVPTPQVSAAPESSDRAATVTLLPLVDASTADAGSCCGGSCSLGWAFA